jgi:hypothetical protein
MSDILAKIEADSRARRMAVRDLLFEKGRSDLVADLDRKTWEIQSGVSQARSTWGALSEPQRVAIVALAEGRRAFRAVGGRSVYDASGRGCAPLGGIRLATLRALMARNLVQATGSPSDPERRFEITKPGAFVVKRGQDAAAMARHKEAEG